jgi:RimJ/RimL family protein N-acetyltransferase
MVMRVLGAEDAAAYNAHLRRLSAHDRSLRFCGGDIPDNAPLTPGNRAVVLGAFIDGQLRAVAELHLLERAAEPTGEVAFSVEGTLQGRGLGRYLFNRILALAAELRLRRVVLICEPRNAPMIHLAQDHGASTCYEDGEVTGTIELAAPAAGPAIPLRAKETAPTKPLAMAI